MTVTQEPPYDTYFYWSHFWTGSQRVPVAGANLTDDPIGYYGSVCKHLQAHAAGQPRTAHACTRPVRPCRRWRCHVLGCAGFSYPPTDAHNLADCRPTAAAPSLPFSRCGTAWRGSLGPRATQTAVPLVARVWATTASCIFSGSRAWPTSLRSRASSEPHVNVALERGRTRWVRLQRAVAPPHTQPHPAPHRTQARQQRRDVPHNGGPCKWQR